MFDTRNMSKGKIPRSIDKSVFIGTRCSLLRDLLYLFYFVFLYIQTYTYDVLLLGVMLVTRGTQAKEHF